ncbi:uncharacterized protein LOC133200936 [Saccostrea echinata]|uniref:uncharacterized protein LOC133200936 n=1 Tax=Saccostrea echinata TaxID=191078 RepID=UPI002A830824|nr:uncharacterized protein LOC133200936 [Saccostrea echinata]
MEHQHSVVEINPINLPIPTCLLHCDVTEDLTPVTLPQRFVRVNREGEDNDGQKCPESREKDIASALQWVKQQMVILRKDDIRLMRRFFELHSAMMELRWVYEGASSMSDVSSYNGSNMSLDDVSESSIDYHISNEEHDTEFRERTTSLQIPRKSRVTRIRWKSNEII